MSGGDVCYFCSRHGCDGSNCGAQETMANLKEHSILDTNPFVNGIFYGMSSGLLDQEYGQKMDTLLDEEYGEKMCIRGYHDWETLTTNSKNLSWSYMTQVDGLIMEGKSHNEYDQ